MLLDIRYNINDSVFDKLTPRFLNNLRAYLHKKRRIPVIVIALNGGLVTLDAIAFGN